jgi:hypothetical protein
MRQRERNPPLEILDGPFSGIAEFSNVSGLKSLAIRRVAVTRPTRPPDQSSRPSQAA